MTRSKVRFAWAIGCSKDTAGGDVVSLYFRVLSRDGVPSPSMHPHLDDSLVLALLDLPALTWLDICVYGGTVAPELGGLQLQYVSINHYCMDGTLPPNLLYGWPGLETLIITRQGDAVDYTDPEIGTCGIRCGCRAGAGWTMQRRFGVEGASSSCWVLRGSVCGVTFDAVLSSTHIKAQKQTQHLLARGFYNYEAGNNASTPHSQPTILFLFYAPALLPTCAATASLRCTKWL